MADGKNLSGDFEFAPVKLAWRAEPPLHLRSFKDGLLQLGLLAAQRKEFIGEKLGVRCGIARRGSPPLRSDRLGCDYCGLCQAGAYRILLVVPHSIGPGHHVHVTPRICNQLREWSENSEARREPARVSGECEQYGRPPCGWSENSRSPRPRREGGRGSRSLRNDRENA